MENKRIDGIYEFNGNSMESIKLNWITNWKRIYLTKYMNNENIFERFSYTEKMQ